MSIRLIVSIVGLKTPMMAGDLAEGLGWSPQPMMPPVLLGLAADWRPLATNKGTPGFGGTLSLGRARCPGPILLPPTLAGIRIRLHYFEGTLREDASNRYLTCGCDAR